MTDQRTRRRGQYLSLGMGEFVSTLLFAAVGWNMARPSTVGLGAALWSALVPLLFLLLQAALYWLAARHWVRRTPMPRPLAQLYSALRLVNLAVLALGLGGVLWWGRSVGTVALLGCLAVWGFAVLEYINYFVMRLSYPPLQWWGGVQQRRRPQLMKDVTGALHP